MKAPTWESSADAGSAFLLSITGKGADSSGAVRDLYTLTLRDGTVRRWTPHTSDITIGSRTFTSRTSDSSIPLITRGGSRTVAGLSEVGALEVSLQCDAATLWGGLPLPFAVMNGLFFGATLSLERLVFSMPGMVPVAAYAVFAGDVEAQPASTSVSLSVESLAARLGRISVPRAIVQERCVNQLGDAACGASIAPVTGTADIGSGGIGTSTTKIYTSLEQASGYFDRSVVTITSGACTGEKRMVISHTKSWWVGGPTILTLDRPLPEAPGGESFSLARNCLKTPEDCNSTFANLARFRGCPYVPTGTEVESV